ncbi:hypothetical protein ASE49_09135 [Novosphingobium sp. Leaf2]|nr:hypothetical protein ASE49_09135 [Novosphingobium sp. Leaf2]
MLIRSPNGIGVVLVGEGAAGKGHHLGHRLAVICRQHGGAFVKRFVAALQRLPQPRILLCHCEDGGYGVEEVAAIVLSERPAPTC